MLAKLTLLEDRVRARGYDDPNYVGDLLNILDRTVGKKRLPTTVGGLLVHVADHTQRHVGQAITTAKVLQFKRR